LKIKDLPSLYDARPCGKGVFFFKSIKWSDILSYPSSEPNTIDPYIGIKFLELNDTIEFYSIIISQNNEVNDYTYKEGHNKSLVFLDKNAMVSVHDATLTFTWTNVPQSNNPQLTARVTRLSTNKVIITEDLGFMREEN